MKQIVRLVIILLLSISINNALAKVTGTVNYKTAEGYDMYFYTDSETKECQLYLVKVPSNASGSLIIPGTVKDTKDVSYKVTEIGSSIISENSDLIKKIVTPNNVVTIGNSAFRSLKNLSEIVINGRLKSIGENSFYGCENLSSISIYGDDLEIKRSAFENCPKLSSVYLRGKVRIIRINAFYMCPNLSAITISGSEVQYESDIFDDGLKTVTLDGEIIRTDPFSFSSPDYKVYPEEIIFPEGVKTIKDRVFCSVKESLIRINIPSTVSEWNPLLSGSNRGISGPLDLGFKKLSSILVSAGNTVYDSRGNCNAVIEKETNTLLLGCKNTVIPNTVRTIGQRAFYYSTELAEINLPERLISIGDYAFTGTSLRSIHIPEMVSSIGISTFPNNQLEKITVAEGNATYDSRNNCNAIIKTQNNELICGCNNTIMPEGIQHIGENAFVSCSLLKVLKLPIKLESIGLKAFYGCTGLEEIEIPSNVESISEEAFYGCSGLISITCRLTDPMDIDENVFILSNGSNKYDIYNNATLYVPKGTKQKYWNAAGWSRFENIVEMEEEAEPVKLIAKNCEREYGEENPVFEYETEENIQVTGQPVISCPATVTSPVGEYPIVITKGSVEENVELVNGILTIVQAPLQVSVGNYQREQGEENPEFVVSYDGFKNDDDERVLTVKPIVATVATKDSEPGSYPIFVYGGEAQNYSFNYTSGTLTVTAPSGIKSVLNERIRDEVFTLTGSRIPTNKVLPRGVYIVNGKKFIVK